MAVLKYGSQGSDVKDLQTRLNAKGYNLSTDGIFGKNTLSAVRDFQGKNNLTVDGIVGQNTRGELALAPELKGGGTATGGTSNTNVFSYNPYKESDVVTEAKTALDSHMAEGKPTYTNSWASQIADVITEINDRGKFSYDVNGDALYQQYKDKYIQQGKLAMQDTMGQAAAMTGGYGNSYAATVGNQAYQAHLSQLNNIIPELYQMAYDRYNQEGQDLYNQYSLLADREKFGYNRYRDSLSDWNNERTYLAGRYDSERAYDYGIYADDKSYAYNEHRNAIADEQWQKQFDLAVAQAGASVDKSTGKVVVAPSNPKMTTDDHSYWSEKFSDATTKAEAEALRRQLVTAGYSEMANQLMLQWEDAHKGDSITDTTVNSIKAVGGIKNNPKVQKSLLGDFLYKTFNR
jgi:peptidoglycan hydrolase-like protein with peptidoglycan-binding domain